MIRESAIGLSQAEVAERTATGKANEVARHTSRTTAAILRANVFTRFNALVSALWIVVAIYGDLADALFGFVMVFNSAIGIVQELRAKRTLDSLRIRLDPKALVVRDGVEQSVLGSELVTDDLFRLAPGDQIQVDGRVVASDGLEVDESALTGEAVPVGKSIGDEARSGSVVVAGSAMAVAIAVGNEAWINRLTDEAREFGLSHSELRSGIDRLLTWIGWIIVPVAVLLFVTQTGTDETFGEGMVVAVAGVVAMVPQGLVLLVSMSMAVAVNRLSRNHVVAQELAAVEGLARVDVICLDKTGTLTTGAVELDTIETFGADRSEVLDGIAALLWSGPTDVEPASAVVRTLPDAPAWKPAATEPFSSIRKWSGADFGSDGTWVMGAPEVLLDAIALEGSPSDHDRVVRRQITDLAAMGRRLLLVSRTETPLVGDGTLPSGMRPVALISLREEIRSDAAATLTYFADQGVAVKIISGDNPSTVSAIASTLGVIGADRTLDLREVEGLDAEAVDCVVFGRAQPEQKKELVDALQRGGHTVAMTGDGVNDIPAMKRADVGIAMDTATPATKAIAQLILLDGRFDRLPFVIGEGRRLIANMERVSALFVTKTVYAVCLAVAVGAAGLTFPFLPRHFSVIGTITIGFPAFVLSFAPSTRPAIAGFLRRTLLFAVPAGLSCAFMTFAVYDVTRSSLVDASQAEARTAATITLTLAGLWVLYRLVRPLDRGERALLLVLVATFAAVFVLPPLADFYALELPRPSLAAAIVAATIANIGLLEVGLDVEAHRGHTFADLA